jgi:hypothetical protein
LKDKTYILLDIIHGQPDQVAHILCGKIGVKTVEVLEGSPEILVALEARSRRRLAELTISALESVENVVESVRLLPVQEAFRVNTPSRVVTG